MLVLSAALKCWRDSRPQPKSGSIREGTYMVSLVYSGEISREARLVWEALKALETLPIPGLRAEIIIGGESRGSWQK